MNVRQPTTKPCLGALNASSVIVWEREIDEPRDVVVELQTGTLVVQMSTSVFGGSHMTACDCVRCLLRV